MARIFGVNLPAEKRIEAALPYIYGIGITKSQRILDEAGVSRDTRTKDLTEPDLNNIRAVLEKYGPFEGDLRRSISANVKRKKDIRSYQGIRHEKKLPVHGQRTKTNNRTVRGNKRMTMGSGRRKSAEKT